MVGKTGQLWITGPAQGLGIMGRGRWGDLARPKHLTLQGDEATKWEPCKDESLDLYLTYCDTLCTHAA